MKSATSMLAVISVDASSSRRDGARMNRAIGARTKTAALLYLLLGVALEGGAGSVVGGAAS